MSCAITHHKIKTVIENQSAVYSLVVDPARTPNMDYAGYACHASLNRMSNNTPEQNAEQLESLMRRAARKHSGQQQQTEQQSWSALMSRCIDAYANGN